MPEPSSNDPWSALADQLGVDPAAQGEPPPPPAAAPPPPPQRAKPPAPPKPRPATNWRDIAGGLGVEVPPEPEPPPKPPPPSKIESRVRETDESRPATGQQKVQSDAPRRDADESGGGRGQDR